MEKYISHNFIEWTMFKAKLKVERYKRGQTVQYMGDVCKKLSFINSGLARAYIIGEDGKDYTWSIFFNDENSHMTNLFVVDYESFVNQTPSNLAIEVIEDCETFCN